MIFSVLSNNDEPSTAWPVYKRETNEQKKTEEKQKKTPSRRQNENQKKYKNTHNFKCNPKPQPPR